MKELLEAGVHFGHQTKRWNPKMKRFIFGKRNGIYIIDLQKTLKQFKEAAKFVTELAASGKNLLFVGTKRQAQDAIYEEANRCGMFFVNTRWLGGTLTNFSTIRKSIHRLKEIEGVLAQEDNENLTKKERSRATASNIGPRMSSISPNIGHSLAGVIGLIPPRALLRPASALRARLRRRNAGPRNWRGRRSPRSNRPSGTTAWLGGPAAR
jgi:hypothetical protein